MKKFRIIVLLILFIAVINSTCFAESIRLATTTSVDNTGLLDALLPLFKKETGISVYAIAVGTGNALRLAENGDVDLILAHAPEAEHEFMENSFGVYRKEVFYNDFIIVGPAEDPAGIGSLGKVSAGEAFRKIAGSKSRFISRGDNSGTHMKELEIWRLANLRPVGQWYMETGQGMMTTLNIANEKGGYCLVDRGTFLTYQDKVDLLILYEGGFFLENTYSLIAVNPEHHPHVKYKEAIAFIGWIISPRVQAVIDNFKKNGKRLFYTKRLSVGLHY